MSELDEHDAGDAVTPLAAITSGNLPYPSPTDPLRNGADAIKALAQKLDDGVYYGGTLRVYANAVSSGYAQNTWTTLAYAGVADQALPTTPGVKSIGGAAVEILRTGLYLFQVTTSMSAAGFAVRLVEAVTGRQMAANFVPSPLLTGSTMFVQVLPVGWKVLPQVYPTTAGASTSADAAATPNTMTVTHLAMYRG